MERISTEELMRNTVEIDGVVYQIAPRTVSTETSLANVRRAGSSEHQYKIWLEELEILLGKTAAAELFHSGKNENIDRIHRIYVGVMRAYDAKSLETAREELENGLGELSRATAALSMLAEKIEKITSCGKGETNRPVIRRNSPEAEDLD